MNKYVTELIERYQNLSPLAQPVEQAIDAITDCYRNGGKVMLCGNGGSAADCAHIVGELMKGYLKKRPTKSADPVISKLQQGLPAISLCEASALITAFCNDVDPELIFAQQVYSLGRRGDVLIGISTSGGARNVAAAVHTARAMGITVIGLTGRDGGQLAKNSDICIIAPENETFKIQECHLPVYHAICGAVEENFFKE